MEANPSTTQWPGTPSFDARTSTVPNVGQRSETHWCVSSCAKELRVVRGQVEAGEFLGRGVVPGGPRGVDVAAGHALRVVLLLRFVEQDGIGLLVDDFLVDDALPDIGLGGQIVHDI